MNVNGYHSYHILKRLKNFALPSASMSSTVIDHSSLIISSVIIWKHNLLDREQMLDDALKEDDRRLDMKHGMYELDC